MIGKDKIVFPAIVVSQPIGRFFVGAMSAEDVVTISRADVRELEENDLDSYMGIQRRLSAPRVKELQSYVNSVDATFPTSVLLAVSDKNSDWDVNTRQLTLRATPDTPLENVARIIDGQHRIEGLKAYRGQDFEVNVSVFVGADIATQAMIFATVNLAQTKVNRSLVYDLFDYEKTRSPQKSAHHIVVALDKLEASPFYHRIKRLGFATAGRDNETLTQAALVESLLDFITDDPMRDRDSFLRKLGLGSPSKEQLRRRPFRGLFLQQKDEDIARIVLAYFSAVKHKWPKSWDNPRVQGNVLPKTNGLKALMRFLKPAYLSIVRDNIGAVASASSFREIFSKVDLHDEDFNIKTFPPGTSGESTLYNRLMADVFGEYQKEAQLGLFQ